MTLTNVEDVYPLSANQAGLLFHTLHDPRSGVYAPIGGMRLGSAPSMPNQSWRLQP